MGAKLKLQISANGITLILTLLSILLALLYKLVFLKMPEGFPNAKELGEIFYNILLSVTAAGIFYFFNVYLNQWRTRRYVFPFIIARLKDISVLSLSLETALQCGTTTEEQKKTFAIKYKDVNLNATPPSGNYNSWRELFEAHIYTVNTRLPIVLEFRRFLSAKMLSKLTELFDSNFERSLRNTQNISDMMVGNSANGLWEYINVLRELTSKGYINELK